MVRTKTEDTPEYKAMEGERIKTLERMLGKDYKEKYKTQKTKTMAKRTKKFEMSEDDKKNYGVSSTEVSKYVNAGLMLKPNKSVIFPSFIKNVVNQGTFITYCLENSTVITPDELKGIVDMCNSKMEEAKKKDEERKVKQERYDKLAAERDQIEIEMNKLMDEMS